MIPVRSNFLAAALVVVPKSDLRPGLNGVLLERGDDGVIFTVATNGQLLLILRDDSPRARAAEWQGRLVLPREPVREFLRSARHPDGDVRLPGEGRPEATLFQPGHTVRFAVMADRFPAWRDAVPIDAPSGIASQFDARNLGELVNIGAVLQAASDQDVLHPHIAHNGPSGLARVVWAGDSSALAVLRPIRAPNPAPSIPWK